MKLRINGETVETDPHSSIRAVLAQLGMNQRPCAVEVNGAVIPRRLHEEHRLQDGDSLEIVTLVGGG